MQETYVLAIDQGTSSTRAMLIDRSGAARFVAQAEVAVSFPQPGWVEQDAEAIWHSVTLTVTEVMGAAGIGPEQIASIGIANQRETTVVWERSTGRPIGPAIVWQSRQTADLCDKLQEQGLEEWFRARTGLVIDAYFSATKVQWLLDRVEGARERARRGELLFGTIDTWLVWKLTGGKAHVTDYSNASRTMLYNIHRLCWDEDILTLLDIPREMLPEVRDSSGACGAADGGLFGGHAPLIAGIAGDQQAALFGQMCNQPGMVKNTYGTGCFMLMHTGAKAAVSRHGLLTTIAWGLAGHVEYALEGSVFVAGSAVQWLRDGLRIIASAAESETLAREAKPSGVYVVPAFTGLGAPYWDSDARGAVFGMTRDTSRAELARATLEAIAYQTKDVLLAMEADTGLAPAALRVDGGASQNDFLMQFQSDLLGCAVERPRSVETTALGAAYLAGLAVGYWSDIDELRQQWQLERSFAARLDPVERERLYAGWQKAVTAARLFK